MRVLQLHKDFAPSRGGGGTARHIDGLATALARRGAEVRVAAPAPERVEAPYRTVAAGVGGLAPLIAWADIVHVHGARSPYAVAGALRSRLAGKPVVYTPHAYYRGRSLLNTAAKVVWDQTAEQFLLGSGAYTILLTEAWLDYLRARALCRDRTRIIPNCIAAREEQERGEPAWRLPGRPAILTVGRLDPVKRVGDIIQALRDPRLGEAHLHIVGTGDDQPVLERLAEIDGVAARVTFHGFVDDAEVRRMAAGSDVFVLASEQEGLPTVLLEMLMAGVPVICTAIPGNLAIMNVAQLTSTYPVGDTGRLAGLLAEANAMTVPPAAIEALGREFTWGERAAEIATLYEMAVAGRAGR